MDFAVSAVIGPDVNVTNVNHLDLLPNELLVNIFEYLGHRDLINFSQTHKRIYEVSSEIISARKRIHLENKINYIIKSITDGKSIYRFNIDDTFMAGLRDTSYKLYKKINKCMERCTTVSGGGGAFSGNIKAKYYGHEAIYTVKILQQDTKVKNVWMEQISMDYPKIILRKTLPGIIKLTFH